MTAATTHPTTLIIFGATGNLAETKIFPSLYDLLRRGSIGADFHIVAFARKALSDDEYRGIVSRWIAAARASADATTIASLAARIHFVQGDFYDGSSYQRLQEKLIAFDRDIYKRCSNKLFYLAVPPNLYENILNHVALSGLTIPCADKEGWTRLLIEKPFGNDLETARSLDKLLGLLFREEQIFRIDHYLAKETVQNILAFRFGNGMFEPLWNREHIESVDIVVSESKVVGSRGAFYDGVGALKDVGQNHVLQMLALVAMERPADFTAASVRAERVRALAALKRVAPAHAVRGQYAHYRHETNVAPDSQTDTAFALRVELATPRFAGVPFYLGSGKGFKDGYVEIVVRFKRPDLCAFGGEACGKANTLTFRIQPTEGITLSFLAKQPGYGMNLEERHLSFSYDTSAGTSAGPDAYERLLFDCIKGDQVLFPSTAELDAQWTFVAQVIEAWNGAPLATYEAGTEFSEWAHRTLGAGFRD